MTEMEILSFREFLANFEEFFGSLKLETRFSGLFLISEQGVEFLLQSWIVLKAGIVFGENIGCADERFEISDKISIQIFSDRKLEEIRI